MEQRITSRKNQWMTHVRRLATSRKYRREQGLFLADGIKLLEEALRWGAEIPVVAAREGLALPPLPEYTQCLRLTQGLMEYISPMETPQGVVALCTIAPSPLPERLEGSRYLVLDGLQDPGNVGTIWRSADALGADGLLLTGDCADPYNPKAIRATMGACFRLPVYEAVPEALQALLVRSALPLYAAALTQESVDVRSVNLSRGAVAIGNEGRGVSGAVMALSQGTLKIPMRPRCESLNAAGAATVILWEMMRGVLE